MSRTLAQIRAANALADSKIQEWVMAKKEGTL